MGNGIATLRDVLGKVVFSQSYSATQKVEIDVQTTLGIYFRGSERERWAAGGS